MKIVRTILSAPFYIIALPFALICDIWAKAGDIVRGV